MMYLCYGFILIAAVIGLTEIIGWVEHKIIFGRQSLHTVTLIPLKGKIDNVELIVRGIIKSMHWNKNSKQPQVVLLDQGMEEETRQICFYLCDDIDGVSLMKSSDLNHPISDIVNVVAIEA